MNVALNVGTNVVEETTGESVDSGGNAVSVVGVRLQVGSILRRVVFGEA